MKIRRLITKKKVIIGALAGATVVGGIVAFIIAHKRKKNYAFIKNFLNREDEFCDEDDIDEKYCGAKMRCCTYAENLDKEYESSSIYK